MYFILQVPYFKGSISTGSKFHISLGHETVLGKLTLFKAPPAGADFSLDEEYEYLDSLAEEEEEMEDGKQRSVFALIEFDGKGVDVMPDCKGRRALSA